MHTITVQAKKIKRKRKKKANSIILILEHKCMNQIIYTFELLWCPHVTI